MFPSRYSRNDFLSFSTAPDTASGDRLTGSLCWDVRVGVIIIEVVCERGEGEDEGGGWSGEVRWIDITP